MEKSPHATECDVCEAAEEPKGQLKDEFKSGWFCPRILYTYLKVSWCWKPCGVHALN